MSHVTVTVAGERYTVACPPGDGPKVEKLAIELDKTVATLRRRVGDIGETRLTVFAALSLLDGLEALRGEKAALLERVATLERNREEAALAVEAGEDAFAERINAVALKVEQLAALMNADTRARAEPATSPITPTPDMPQGEGDGASHQPQDDRPHPADPPSDRLDIAPGEAQ